MAKSIRKDLSQVSDIDWARMAAFIDGEGHIRIGLTVHRTPKLSGRTHYECIDIIVTNCDPRLIQWLHQNFGGRAYPKKQKLNPRWRPSFCWTLSAVQAAAVLKGCLPYFVIKREQAELALAMQATMVKCGVKGTPQHVIDTRRVIRSQLMSLTARGPRKIEQAS